MNGRYLLDTRVIIALFAADAAVMEKLEQASEIFIPCMAIGELYYGAWKFSLGPTCVIESGKDNGRAAGRYRYSD